MQESFTFEHGSELVANTLKQLLDGSRVTQEGNSHFQSTGRDITLSSQDIVGDPLDEIGRVFALNILHLLLDFLH